MILKHLIDQLLDKGTLTLSTSILAHTASFLQSKEEFVNMGQEISGLDPSTSEIPKCFIVVVAPMVTGILYLLTHSFTLLCMIS